MPADRTRRTTTSREVAEAAFKAATTKPAELPPKRPTIPNAKELVSLRIDRDILDHFQDAGPGWQDRINEALRKGSWKVDGAASDEAAPGSRMSAFGGIVLQKLGHSVRMGSVSFDRRFVPCARLRELWPR
jgi:uncharacterized protein (DUF4415 family)